MSQFAYGWVTPVFATMMSTVGCLLGLLLAARARHRTGGERHRSHACAALAIGGTGLWLAHEIYLIGMGTPASTIRFAPIWTVVGLGVAIAMTFAALTITGSGSRSAVRRRPSWWRLLLSWALLCLGIAGTQWAGTASLQVGGRIGYESVRLAIAACLATVIAFGTLWCTYAARSLRTAIRGGLLIGATVSGLDYVVALSLRIQPDSLRHGVFGLSPTTMLAPTVLIGVSVTAMLGYFTFGRSTMRDLRAIYTSAAGYLEAIEPWMIEAVLLRVTTPGATRRLVLPAGTLRPSGTVNDRSPRLGVVNPARAALRPRPTPGIQPIWRSMPTWGTPLALPAGRDTTSDVDQAVDRSPVLRSGNPRNRNHFRDDTRNRRHVTDHFYLKDDDS